ncbi:MAG TPA: hypothetical protein VG675_00660 [Bryobacteraceae bacterium]|nr:hypothetical protein [Bryobacteraceae bacterium]
MASGTTLTSGTLSYYPVANPSAVITLNANTTGSGQIGSIDTTTLLNGTYYLVLNATDSTGKTQSNGAWIVVGGRLQAGPRYHYSYGPHVPVRSP